MAANHAIRSGSGAGFGRAKRLADTYSFGSLWALSQPGRERLRAALSALKHDKGGES